MMHARGAESQGSVVSGTSSEPLLYRTVDGVLKAALGAGPQRPALIVPHQSVRLSYAELDGEVERVAHGLIACGLERGERIGIWAPNCAEWVLTMFAAARAGLVLVNLNPAYRTSELEFALRLVGCWAKRRIRPRLRPWKLLFLMNSYRLTLSSSNAMHRWLRK